MIDTLRRTLEQELKWEKKMFLFLNNHHFFFGDYFLKFCSNLWVEICVYTIFFLFLLLIDKKKKQGEILLIIFSIVLVFLFSDKITSDLFKPIFHRLRPIYHPYFKDQVQILSIDKKGLYGFISSHTAIAFGFTTIFSLIFRNRSCRNIMTIFACIVGYSRIYFGMHFISDVIGGALVGILIGIFVYQLHCICRIQFSKLNI